MNKVSPKPSVQAVLTKTVKAGGVPSAGETVFIDANMQQKAEIAKIGNLAGIEKLTAEVVVKPRGKELSVRGRIDADVIYTCVLTLENFTHHIEEKIDVTYAPPQGQAKHLDLSFGDSTPEELVNGQAHVGALVQEMFLLALDPYPHKPGADFSKDTDPSAPLDVST